MLVYTITKGNNKSFVYDIYHGIQGEKGDQGIQGEQGIQGVPGTAATIQVGNVTSGAAPSVTNVGTSNAAIFDFVLEKGDKGDQGDKGQAAGFGTPTASATALPVGSDPTVSVTASGDPTQKVFAFSFGIPSGGDDNVQADWNQTNTSADDYIKNKPTIPVVATAIAAGDTGYTTGDQVYTALQNFEADVYDIRSWKYKETENQIQFYLYKNGAPASNLNLTAWLTAMASSGSSKSESYMPVTAGNAGLYIIDLTQNAYTALKDLDPQYRSINMTLKTGTYPNYTELCGASGTFFRSKPATSIASGENGFTTGDQVYTALQSAGHDVYEFGQIRFTNFSNTPKIEAYLFKNGEQLKDTNVYYDVKYGPYTEQAFVRGGTTNTGSSGSVVIDISSAVASHPEYRTFFIRINKSSSDPTMLCAATVQREWQATSIASGDIGYTTGDQVYQVVGDVETLLAAL